MAETSPQTFALGALAPSFRLPDTLSGKSYSLSELKGSKGTLILFICNHCPYVKHVEDKILELARLYQPKGIAFIAISSNDPELYPEDGPENMKREGQAKGYPFPYLFDETQEVARDYKAACTPDFYLFDQNLRSIYHGRLDGSTPKTGTPTGSELSAALDACLASMPVPQPQKPSIGCSIKWKKN